LNTKNSQITSTNSEDLLKRCVQYFTSILPRQSADVCQSNISSPNSDEILLTSTPNETSKLTIKYQPIVDEVHVSSIVLRRGYLNFFEENHIDSMTKKYVVIRRPFAFIYNHEKDYVERELINLGTARIELNDDGHLNGTRHTLTVVTKYRTYLVQPLNEKDFYDWLYAFNPLLAGQIK